MHPFPLNAQAQNQDTWTQVEGWLLQWAPWWHLPPQALQSYCGYRLFCPWNWKLCSLAVLVTHSPISLVFTPRHKRLFVLDVCHLTPAKWHQLEALATITISIWKPVCARPRQTWETVLNSPWLQRFLWSRMERAWMSFFEAGHEKASKNSQSLEWSVERWVCTGQRGKTIQGDKFNSKQHSLACGTEHGSNWDSLGRRMTGIKLFFFMWNLIKKSGREDWKLRHVACILCVF